jgi:hypothetical protein
VAARNALVSNARVSNARVGNALVGILAGTVVHVALASGWWTG